MASRRAAVSAPAERFSFLRRFLISWRASSCHSIGFSRASSGIPALTRSEMRLRTAGSCCGWRGRTGNPSRHSFATIFSGFRLFLAISNSPSAAAGRASCIESGSSQTDRVENQSSLRNRRENAMSNHAALDVSQEATAICVVDEVVVAEKKIASCTDVIAAWLTKNARDLARAGIETGPLAVWRWNELRDKGLPIVPWTPGTPMRSRRHLFWTKGKVRMMPVGPLELRLPGVHISAGVRTTLL
jgi:hypothetical protein